jgi:hypothetical protein
MIGARAAATVGAATALCALRRQNCSKRRRQGAGRQHAPGAATLVKFRRRPRINASARLAALERALESPRSFVMQDVDGSTEKNVGLNM